MRSVPVLLLTLGLAHADVWTDHFTIDPVSIPPGIDRQIGGISPMPNGKLAICFHRGEVLVYDPADDSWSRFAEGLHEPLGILAESDSSFLVMQRPELTRLRDTDGDGEADLYETVFDGFGMTGNYHEFAFGPARDTEGNLYISLNVASNGAGVRPEVRGDWSPIGLEQDKMVSGTPEWQRNKGRAGRMYSRVPYRGWVIKVSPDGKSWEPFASGFRSPEGLGFDADGLLYVTDNQGDWLGTSKVHDVRKGGFYGHVASLVWKPGWTREPLKVPVEELEAMRTPAMGLLPQGELANSPTEPRRIPEGIFGPLGGQMLIGEMNQATLIRFLPDQVGEVSQGAAIPFLQTGALGHGNHRLAFTEDGSLWIGKTHLSWAGQEGLMRIRLKEDADNLLAVEDVKLMPEGFAFRFTQPVDPRTNAAVQARRHTYKYHAAYGSPKVDDSEVTCGELSLSEDGRTGFLKVSDLRERYVYTMKFPDLRSRDGRPLLGSTVYYNLVRKR